MKKSWKKASLGLLVAGAALGVVGCGNSKDKAKTEVDDKVLEVTVDKGYIKYLNEIKGSFEKDNGVKVKLNERDMFEQLDALALDGPAGKHPM